MVTSTRDKVEGASDDAKRQAVQDEADIRDTVQLLVSTVPGRAFLWHLLKIGKWGTQPFTGEFGTTAFAAGELNVGQQVFALIASTTPEGLLLMMKERNNAGRIDPTSGAAADAISGTLGTYAAGDVADPYDPSGWGTD